MNVVRYSHRTTANSSDWPIDYGAQFWASYPHRITKKAATAALERVRRSPHLPPRTPGEMAHMQANAKETIESLRRLMGGPDEASRLEHAKRVLEEAMRERS
jgi:hypothetical protein